MFLPVVKQRQQQQQQPPLKLFWIFEFWEVHPSALLWWWLLCFFMKHFIYYRLFLNHRQCMLMLKIIQLGQMQHLNFLSMTLLFLWIRSALCWLESRLTFILLTKQTCNWADSSVPLFCLSLLSVICKSPLSG